MKTLIYWICLLVGVTALLSGLGLSADALLRALDGKSRSGWETPLALTGLGAAMLVVVFIHDEVIELRESLAREGDAVSNR